MSLPYKIKFTIGSLWGSGHGKKEQYIVASSLPVEDLQKIYIKSVDLLGFDICDLCRDYGECYLSEELYYKIAKALDFKEVLDRDDEYWEEENYKYILDGPDELLSIMLKSLKKTEPELKLEVVSDVIPDFHSIQGAGDLKIPGYGLFH